MMIGEGQTSFSCRKCHFLAMALCFALLCQLGAQIDADNAKMSFPAPAAVRRPYHPIGGRPTQHGHSNFRDETNVVAASTLQPQHQQSYAVAVPQAPPHLAFDYGAAKPAGAPSSYSSGSDYQPSPGYEDDHHLRNKSATQPHNDTQALHNTAEQNALEQRRAKRRCPREAFLQSSLNVNGMHGTARIAHRVASHTTTGTEFSSGPQPRIGERLHAVQQYAAPAQPISVSKSKGLVGPEYEQSVVEQLPPSVKPPRLRTKTRRPSSNGGTAASGSCNMPPCNGGDHTWAYIKKPKKQRVNTRPVAPAAAQAVTPAPSGTALGGVGKYFTALPPGAKGTHYQTINSKNLPTLTEAHRYYYPPRMPLPLPSCFHNPTGYPCCNPSLNDLMVETYTDLESKPKFHTCNINAIAQHMQLKAEERFNTSFETVAAFDDFAQKIHFYSDLVCKVELGGKYMLAYATVKDAGNVLSKEQSETNSQPDQQSSNSIGSGNSNAVGNVASRSGSYPATAIREKRENPMAFVGPLLKPATHDLHYTMWI